MADKDKKKFLEAAGAFNPDPGGVKDEKFQQPGGFFDPLDKVQVKYEMLRAHAVDGETVTEAARRFDYTRESFYQNLGRIEREGILGLADRKRGRKGPVKLSPEVVEFLRTQREEDPKLSGADLAEKVAERFGVELHRRTVEKALRAIDRVQKKTTVSRSKKAGPRARTRKNS